MQALSTIYRNKEGAAVGTDGASAGAGAGASLGLGAESTSAEATITERRQFEV
jgi:hypothetical protein